MADENVVLVSFEEESKAYQAATVLKEASAQGRIDLHAVAVAQRMEDGTLRVKEGDADDFPVGTWTGGSLAARPVGSSVLPWARLADPWGSCWAAQAARCWAPCSTSTPPRKQKASWPRWPEPSSRARRPSSHTLRSRR